MIPGATEIAQGGVIVTAALDAYPIIAVVLAFVTVLSFGVGLVIWIRRALPKRG